ncbi:MAG: tetratricopeptide repeat protein [Pseudomonadota bacterium]
MSSPQTTLAVTPHRLPTRWASVLGLLWLAACAPAAAPAPGAAQIEASAMRAAQQKDRAAEQQLQGWAAAQLPVAQRELGLLYSKRPGHQVQAMAWCERAARAGDTEAAFQLAELYRRDQPGQASRPALAWPWYRQAALQHHARSALMLALMARNGEGRTPDDSEAAGWLLLASELGHPHAMFLLANVYRDGQGVPADAGLARHWLEQAAEHEYPPAMQEWAMTMQAGDALTVKDPLRASHLLKEASEHRHNNWNRF